MEIIKEIYSKSKIFKVSISKRSDGLYCVDEYKWEGEWEIWSALSKGYVGTSKIETYENAYIIGIEKMRNCSGDQIDENSYSDAIILEKKNVFIAGILTFIYPGLGQIYNGQVNKGLLFTSIPFVILGISVISFGVLFTILLYLALYLFVFFYIVYFVFWISTIVDVVVNTILINKGKVIIKSRIKKSKKYFLIAIGIVIAILWWYSFSSLTISFLNIFKD